MDFMDRWGPFASGIDTAELRARLRALRTIVHLRLGERGAALARLLHGAETDVSILDRAVELLNRLPSLDRRRVLASYAALASPIA